MPPKRKYDEDYIQFGFTCIEKNGIQSPQCVICHQVLSAHSMKPALLKRHLKGIHPDLVQKDKDFFIRKRETAKLARLDRPGGPILNIKSQMEASLEASFAVAYRIAQAKKPHTIGENLILPCTRDIVQLVLGAEAAQKIQNVPLSDNTVQRRIAELSENIEEQVISELKSCELGTFAIQLDESTDVSSLAQLLVYVRYIHLGNFKEEFLFCKPLPTHTRGQDVFKLIDEYFIMKGLDWKNVIGVCTDGAPSMLGCKSGFQTIVKQKNADIVFLHCMIHRQALAVKTMPLGLQVVMKEVIKVINFVKNGALNTRLFAELCEQGNSEYNKLLFYAETRWLTRGNSLQRVYILRDEIQSFFEERNRPTTLFDDDNCTRLAYLVEIYTRLNKVNLMLQGNMVTITDVVEKLNALQKKLLLWKSKILQNDISMFETVYDHIKEKPLSNAVQEDICDHLSQLHEQFEQYFPNLNADADIHQLARKPFTCESNEIGTNNTAIQEMHIDLINDSSAKDLFEKSNLISFWCKMAKSYQSVTKLAMNVLLPFATTYRCESGFSAMVHIKSKYRNRLALEADMRCACATTKPNIKDLVKKHQAQGSH